MADPFVELDAAVEAAGPEERAALVLRTAAVLAKLGALLASTPVPERTDGADKNLSVKETAERLSVSPEWVYRNARNLPSLRLGRRLLFSERGIERYLQRRRA